MHWSPGRDKARFESESGLSSAGGVGHSPILHCLSWGRMRTVARRGRESTDSTTALRQRKATYGAPRRDFPPRSANNCPQEDPIDIFEHAEGERRSTYAPISSYGPDVIYRRHTPDRAFEHNPLSQAKCLARHVTDSGGRAADSMGSISLLPPAGDEGARFAASPDEAPA
jgi:hypothetical protein